MSKNCHFFSESIKYLYQVIAPGKLQVARKTIKPGEALWNPKNVSEMRICQGLCNVYRRFMLGCSKIAAPANRKLKQWDPNKPFLGEKMRKAVNGKKNRLINPLLLEPRRQRRQYSEDTIVSDTQVGCVLLREQKKKSWSQLAASSYRYVRHKVGSTQPTKNAREWYGQSYCWGRTWKVLNLWSERTIKPWGGFLTWWKQEDLLPDEDFG